MSKKLIILIDDNKNFILTISSLLNTHGFDTIISFDAVESLTLLKTKQPDMIIMDPAMRKGFSGFKLYQTIRADAAFNRIPIVVLSGIETYKISSQIIGMYREMRGKDDFETKRVLRIVDPMNKITGIEYYDEDGKLAYIEPELFLPKTTSHKEIISEITKLINHETGI